MLDLLTRLNSRGKRFDETPFGQRLAPILAEANKLRRLKNLNENSPEVRKFIAMLHTARLLNAFNVVSVIGRARPGGSAALEKEMLHCLTKANYRQQVEKTGLGLEMLLEDLAAIDVQKLKGQPPEVLEGLRSIMYRVAGSNKGVQAEVEALQEASRATATAAEPAARLPKLTSCEGATHELHIARLFVDATDELPEGLQVARQVGKSSQVRNYDGKGPLGFMHSDLGNTVRHYDSKAVDPDTFLEGLGRDIRKLDQPLRDVAAMAERSKGVDGFDADKWDVTWLLDARSTGKGFETSAPKAIAQTIRSSPAAQKYIRQAAGLNNDQLDNLLEQLETLLSKSFRVAPGRVPPPPG